MKRDGMTGTYASAGAWLGFRLLLLAIALLLPRVVAAQERFEVSAERALLRAKPSTESPSIKVLGQGTEVVLLDQSGGWARVRVGQTVGYVRRALLVASGVEETPAPVATVAATPLSTAAVSPPPSVYTPPETPRQAPGSSGRDERSPRSSTSRLFAEADASGAASGQTKSVTGASVLTGLLSFSVPGSGFLYLLFLHEAGPDDINPTFMQRAELQGKSTEYMRHWAQAYDRTLTARQRRAVLMGSTIGTVAGLAFYKFVVFRGPPSGGYGYGYDRVGEGGPSASRTMIMPMRMRLPNGAVTHGLVVSIRR